MTSSSRSSLKSIVSGMGNAAISAGIWDCLSAKVAEVAGFDCLELGSYHLAASIIGRLDIGLYTLTELARTTRSIASVVKRPIFIDAEQGFGTAIHMIRTIQDLENAGGSGVMIDDKVMETCPWLPNPAIAQRYWRGVIPEEEMVGKVKAAAHARSSENFVIKFRSNVRGPGLKGPIEPAIERCKLAIEAGADMLRIGANTTEELELWNDVGVPLEVTVGESKLLDGRDFREIARMGKNIRIIVVSTPTIRVATKKLLDSLTTVLKEGNINSLKREDMPVGDWMDLFGVQELSDQIEQFIPAAQ